jgi:hypothetical protein
MAQVLEGQKFEWKMPTEVEIATHRQEYRNLYGFGVEFVH